MKRIIKLTESDLTRIVRRVLNEQNPKGSTISAQAQIKIDKAVTDSQSTLNTVLYKPVFWVSSNMSVHEYADGASYKDSITKVEFFNRQDGLLGITFRYNLIKSPIYDLCLSDPGMIGIGKPNQVKQIPISFDNVVKHVFNGTMAQGEGRTYTDEKGRLITVVVNPVTSKDTITAVVNMLLTLSEKYAKGIWTKS